MNKIVSYKTEFRNDYVVVFYFKCKTNITNFINNIKNNPAIQNGIIFGSYDSEYVGLDCGIISLHTVSHKLLKVYLDIKTTRLQKLNSIEFRNNIIDSYFIAEIELLNTDRGKVIRNLFDANIRFSGVFVYDENKDFRVSIKD